MKAPTLCLQGVDEPRVGKNRMHLDLETDDLEKLATEIQEHGGSHVGELIVFTGGTYYVMTDPEGNEFCVGAWAD